MKGLHRIEIIDKIGRELQSRMTFSDIDIYLGDYGIDCSKATNTNSKYVYVKEILAYVKENIIIDIANELEIKHPVLNREEQIKTTDLRFWKSGYFRLFISHLAEHKIVISALKDSLDHYCISGFVAHEDIEPTKKWQDEIEKALFSMDALVAVLTPKFNESKWTDQEIGVAIGRDILIIPIRKGLDPYGFIGKYQGFQSNGKTVIEVAQFIFEALSSSDKTKDVLFDKVVNLFFMSKNKKEAIERLALIEYFKSISVDKISDLHVHFIEYSVLNDSDILFRANQIFKKYNLSSIGNKDFEVHKTIVNDELPF